MRDTKRILMPIKEVLDWIESMPGHAYNSNLKYSFERVEEMLNGLDKYARFKVGDMVKLDSVPEISEKVASGWLAYKDKLIKGAVGEIRSVDFYNNRFRYEVVFSFDDGLFTLDESYLDKYDNTCPCCGIKTRKEKE